MKLFWLRLSKQKFMHFVAAILVLHYAIVSSSMITFLMSHYKSFGVETTERMMYAIFNQVFNIVMLILAYFFARNNQNNDHIDHEKI